MLFWSRLQILRCKVDYAPSTVIGGILSPLIIESHLLPSVCLYVSRRARRGANYFGFVYLARTTHQIRAQVPAQYRDSNSKPYAEETKFAVRLESL